MQTRGQPSTTATTHARVRKPHVAADRASRILKARKIVTTVGPGRFARCRDILEVGCGSGLISATLASLDGGDRRVEGVDVVDSRVEREGYHFTLVHDTTLPFASASFDLVISNHVIEHVGDAAAQVAHLRELKRVAGPDGVIYLAVPNKWRFVEPHYRLPLLSWLPAKASDAYVRVARGAKYYDCAPRSHRRLTQLFDIAGLSYADRTVETIRTVLDLEHPRHPVTRLVNGGCPDWLLRLGMPIVPTFVFLLHANAA